MSQAKIQNKGKNQSNPPEPFSLFTGGKSAAFAIYYNMAQDNLKELTIKLENKTGKKQTNADPKQKDQVYLEAMSDATFIALRNYLWKGYEFNKNKSGYELEEADKKMIIKLCRKMETLRNFHSHYWHDNAGLEFDDDLKRFVEEKLDIARADASTRYTPDEMDFFTDNLKGDKFPFFKQLNNKWFITQEGRCFFLSFFLLKGQMNSFLQQYKGSKRTDMPMFKVKRDIYTYFTHHDGASVTGFHLTEGAFDELEAAEKKEILQARQAYKIIAYLNDIPELYSDPETVPLFINRQDELVPCTTIQHLVTFCREQDIFNDWQFTEIDFEQKDTDTIEQVKRTGEILMNHKQLTEYTFKINHAHLYKLIVQRIRKGADYENFITRKLQDFCKERQHFFYFLVQQYHTRKPQEEPVEFTDEDLKGFILRGDVDLQEYFGAWQDSWLKERKVSVQLTWNLLNMLRPVSSSSIRQLGLLPFEKRPAHEPFSSAPIVLLSQYFFMGAEKELDFDEESQTIPKIRLQQKPRAENHFVRYAAQFLIDKNWVPQWQWLVENHTITLTEDVLKNKLHKKYHPTVPDGWRLHVKENKVVIKIENPDKSRYGEQDYFLFGLGVNALRYLIACGMLHTDKKKLNAFLANVILTDMARLVAYSRGQGDRPDYLYLEDQYIPAIFGKRRKASLNEPLNFNENAALLKGLREAVEKKIDSEIDYLNDVKSKAIRLRKAEKNRLILDCYQYFDWTETVGKKFLRASEYNQLSICHYLLHDKGTAIRLFNQQFGLRTRVPKQVHDLLNTSKSLNNLLENTIEEALKYLNKQMQSVPPADLEPKRIKRPLVALAESLGVAVPDVLLGADSLEKRLEEREKTIVHIPFDIHPNLVLKYFYKKEYEEGYFKFNSLWQKIHTEAFEKGLYTEHYDITGLVALYESCKHLPARKGSKKNDAVLALQKLKGAVATCHHEDVLLWFMAQEYLMSSSYTSHRAKEIQKCLKGAGDEISVKNLHTGMVTLPVSHAGQPDYYIRLRMHQLDDLLFQSNVQKLHDAVTHLVRRQEEEQVLLAPPTARVNAVSLDEVNREIQKVRRDGQALCEKIFDREKEVLLQYCQSKNFHTPANMQQYLLQEGQQKNDRRYMKFNKVLAWAKELGLIDDSVAKELGDARYGVLHSCIPVNGSFKAKTLQNKGDEPTALGKFLDITEPLDTKKDRSMYELKNDATG
jgi:hypothetical protein